MARRRALMGLALPLSSAVASFGLFMLLFSIPAQAQMGGISFTNSSSANELVNGLFDNPTFERESATQTLIPSGPTIQTRYFGLASADCGPACGPKTETLNTNYTVNWNVTAPNIFRVQIDTRRTAGLTCVDEGTGNCVSAMNNVTCTPSGGTLVSGACTLADPADANTSSTVDVNVNQTNSMTRCGQSLNVAQPFSMNFVWTQSATTPGTGFISINSDESAVRLGGTSDDGTESAADYPGIGGRTQANDGHFMTVTYTNLCGNGVIDSCGAASEQCDQGVNNGTPGSCCNSNCTLKAAGVTCRGALGDCDEVEQCDGVSPTCPADDFIDAGVECRGVSSGDLCDEPEQCTGSSADCPADGVLPAGTDCRLSAGECDIIEECDGVAKQCPPIDAKQPNGTPCTPDPNPCSLDQCNGVSNLCQHPAGNAGAICRPQNGVCDVDETCDGVNLACPANQFATSGVCRIAAGDCDQAESCNGSGPNCPVDGFLNASTPCRPAVDDCDAAENCPGNGPNCPADAVEPPSTVCRISAGDCDVAENCDGIGTACPADQVQPASTVCRNDTGECDVQEVCNGVNPACPADDFEDAGTPCGSNADGECTDPDTCNGAGVCQTNNEPNGTACDDGGSCTFDDQCTNGACVGDASDCPLDHYKCYQGRDLKDPKFTKQTIQLTDQILATETVELKKVKFVCNPVSKAGEPIFDANAHLTCYQVKAANLSPRPSLLVSTQFQVSRFQAKKAKLVCVPGSKTIVP